MGAVALITPIVQIGQPESDPARILTSSDASSVNGETLFCDNGMLVRT
jgi:hypothetical protein